MALDPSGEHLAVGAIDGQVSLYSLISQDAPTRLYRSTCAESSSGSFCGFSGLDFLSSDRLLVAANAPSSGAAIIDVEANGTVVSKSTPWTLSHGQSSLMSAAPLSSGSSPIVFLLHTC